MSEIRISDIFKKKEDDDRSKPKKEEPTPNLSPDQINMNLSEVVDGANTKEKSVDFKELSELYNSALSRVKELYKLNIDKDKDFFTWMSDPLVKIVGYLSSGQRDILNLCLCSYPAQESYLHCHPVNVGIMSLYIGVSLEYDRSRLIELGVAGLIHDIGMIDYFEIINKPAILNKEEYVEVKKHPDKGFEVLTRIAKGIPQIILDTVRQEHERIDGSGYPKGLKESQINPYAQIIGLVDVYEAMMHDRPYRSHHNPLDTIKTILNNKSAFASSVAKTLIDKIGIFPVGMHVRLNTKEIGLVVKGNPRLPLRPVVEIRIDAQGNELKSPKRIDLAENSVVYIERCLED